MEKIINVKVCGSEIEQSTGVGGIQGEGGSRELKISFDEEWSAYSKSVTFLDANMENAVKVILTTANKNSDGSYSVPIPSAPLKTGGKFTYIIDGSADGVLQRSVKKELKVRYAPIVSSASLPSAVTPTEADQLNLSIQKESARVDSLEERMTVAEGDIDKLEAAAESHEATLSNHESAIITVRGYARENHAEISALAERTTAAEADIDNLETTVSENKTENENWHNALIESHLPLLFDINVPKKSTTDQATEGTNDTNFLTPKTGKAQLDHFLAQELVNTPEIFAKETVDGMNAITNMKHGDMCIILSGDTAAQSIYRYYTKDIDGNALTTPQWVWLTDLSLFAPQPVLELEDGMWDYSLGNSAKVTFENLSGGGDNTDDTIDDTITDVTYTDTTVEWTILKTPSLEVSNVYSGAYGVIDVYGGEPTLPENSYAFPPDWDYLEPGEGQHYRYSFYYDGNKFDWSRSVRNDN